MAIRLITEPRIEVLSETCKEADVAVCFTWPDGTVWPVYPAMELLRIIDSLHHALHYVKNGITATNDDDDWGIYDE